MKGLQFKLHLFDLDDTLLQTRSSYHAAQRYAVEQLFENQNIEFSEQAIQEIQWFSKQIGSIDPPTYMGAFLKNRGLLSEANLTYLIQCYRESYWGAMKLYPGAEKYLQFLQADGKLLGLVSNGTTSTQQKKIKTTHLSPYFDESARFISGDFDRLHKKPHPFMLEQAMAFFAVSAEETIYYGNTQDDVLAANLAGVTSLWYGPDSPGPNAPTLGQPDIQWDSWPS